MTIHRKLIIHNCFKIDEFLYQVLCLKCWERQTIGSKDIYNLTYMSGEGYFYDPLKKVLKHPFLKEYKENKYV